MSVSYSVSPKSVNTTPADVARNNCVQLMNYQEVDMSSAVPEHHGLNLLSVLPSPLVEATEMPDDHLKDGL
jgi:hypothetical protein